MELVFLQDIVAIFALAIIIIFFCHRLRIPTIVGFLVTGILAGPHVLGLISDVHEVESLAEIGVVLLLFTIGLEFSFKHLLQIKKSVLLGGSLQVILTFLAGFGIATQLGQPFGQSVFIGFLLSLSSTAIVLKLIQERAEIDSPHGKTALGILIFQDIIIVPMILFTPLLAGTQDDVGASLLVLLGKGIAIIAFVIVSARWLAPYLLYQIARTRDRELFLFSIMVLGLAVAWLTSSVGLSLALGAFLAGLIISESEYSHQALGNILPFKDIFTSFFFISIGMLLDVEVVLAQPLFIAFVTIGVLLLKAVIASFSVMLLGQPIRTVILSGFALSQVGEFAFVLAGTGITYGLLAGDTYQLFLAVSIMTMALTPVMIAVSPRVADFVAALPLPDRLKFGFSPTVYEKCEAKTEHLVIVGFGFNGRNVARAAAAANIPYYIIEMNAEAVRAEQAKGEPIIYGDATHEAVLEQVDIHDARVVVVAISDPAATRRITEIIRRLSPKAYIIVRTRYVLELEPLHEIGADEVIPEEFETSVEIFTRVLKKYLVPADEIEEFVDDVRAGSYEMFRSLSKRTTSFSDFKLHLPDIQIRTFRIGENSIANGKTLGDIAMRKSHGVSVLAIRRDGVMMSNPHGDTGVIAGDLVVVVGSREKILAVAPLLRG